MTVTVKVTNEERLYRKLRAIPEIYREKIKQALAGEADEIVEFMKRLAPVLKTPDRRRTPGTLRDSIGWRWGSRAPKGTIAIGRVKAPAAGEGGAITLTIYAGGKTAGGDAFYATFVEFGTRKMGARPFFFPAYRAKRKETRRRVQTAIRQAAKEAASVG